jgi:hypothetical protein
MRPDEIASEDESERNRRLEGRIAGGFKTAAKIGIGATGLGAASKIAPFLSELIPVDLAMKGINKLAPKVGQFLKKGQEMGLNIKEGLDFLKKNMGGNEKPPEQKSIISQYSPELNQFIEEHIKKGRQPLEAGALAQLDPKFMKIIKKMEADHKTPFSSILQATFGGAQQPRQQQQAQPQQQQGGGPGQQALMAILQKINQGKGQT